MIKQLLSTEQRSAIERWCRERAIAVPMPDGNTLCRVLGELRMIVDLTDYSVAPHLAMDGYWEMWNTMCLARRVKTGWKCIDVGANFGYHTMLLAMLTGAHVEAWEPTELSAFITANARLNGVSERVTVQHAAVGSCAATVEMLRPPNDFGSTGRWNTMQDMSGKQFSVQVRPLDSSPMFSTVNFIKIDAEGDEQKIWEGMSEIVKGDSLRAMLMEWTPKRYEDPKRFLAEIVEAGFRVGIVDGAGGVQPPAGDITAIDGHLDLWLER